MGPRIRKSTNKAAHHCCLKNKCSIQTSHLTSRPVSTSQSAETQDAESAFGSDSSSVLEWKPAEPVNVARTSSPATKKPLTALRVQVRQIFFCFLLRSMIFWGAILPAPATQRRKKSLSLFLCSSEGGQGQQHGPGLHDVGEGLQDRPGRRRRRGKVQLPAPSLQERVQTELQRHAG